MVPGPGPLMPLSQVPTALGRESSISGPSDEARPTVGSVSNVAIGTPARPTPNFFNAARRVTDWAICFVSSSNWLLMFFLSFLFFLLNHGFHGLPGLFSRLTGRLSDRRCW